VEGGRVVEIAGLFLVGMVLQRRRLFAEASERRQLWLRVLIGGGVLWGAARLAAAHGLPVGTAEMTSVSLLSALDQYAALGATAFQVAAFVLLWGSPLRPALASFAPAGRMTLTLYVGQSLMFAPILYGYGWGLWDDVSNAQAILWGLAAFALQVALAALWFRAYRYGPLEWLWRAATRTTLAVPFRQT